MKNLMIKLLGGYTESDMTQKICDIHIVHVQEMTRVLANMQQLRARAMLLEIQIQRVK